MTYRIVALLLVALVATGCRSGGRWAWVEDEVVPASARCRGGTVNTEKRITDITIAGRTRNTTTRTDACLD